MKRNVIVLGVGAMGSAACHRLSLRGHRVLGLEAFAPGHDRGSSHGQSRLIRQAYFEHPDYVPLLKSAYALWDQLEREAGERLFHRSGLVIYGPESGSGLLPKIEASAAVHGIPIERLDGGECRRRFPQLPVPDGYAGILEPGAGYLDVERAVVVQAQLAETREVEIRPGERVLNWRIDGEGVAVTTIHDDYKADRLVITAGAWAAGLLAELGLGLRVHRQLMYWVPAGDELEARPGMPCFAYESGKNFFYGFPKRDPRGIKVANHVPGPVLEDPLGLSDEGWESDWEPLGEFLKREWPAVGPAPCARQPCLYTMSPDGHFFLGVHPDHPQVALAAGFSGHGFKFAPIIGEVLADLCESGRTSHPIGFLGLRR